MNRARYMFSYTCPGQVPELIACNATTRVPAPSAASPLAVYRFRSAFDSLYHVSVCGVATDDGGVRPLIASDNVVIHVAATETQASCTGTACCSPGMSVYLANEDVAYIEVNASTATDLIVDCPIVRPWMLGAPASDGATSDWPTHGVVMKRDTDNRWLTVCEDGPAWTAADADVACRGCGFGGGVKTTIDRSELHFQVGGSDTIGGANCTGTEVDLSSCGNPDLDTPGTCASTFPAVRCFMSTLTTAVRQLRCSNRVVVQAESSPEVCLAQYHVS